jgi:hypothetical protein
MPAAILSAIPHVGHDTVAGRLLAAPRLPWWALAVGAGVMIHLAIVLAMAVDGQFSEADSWAFWRNRTLTGTVVAYLLLVYPVITRLRDTAVESLRAMSQVDKTEFDRLRDQAAHSNPLAEVATVLFWVGVGFWSDRPWEDYPGARWQTVWGYPTLVVLWGLAGATIYHAVHGTLAVERMHHRAKLRVDLFAESSFSQVTRWSLGVSAITLVGVTIAVIFLDPANLTHVETYAPVLAFTLLGVGLFFVNLHVVYGMLSGARRQVMSDVRRRMCDAVERLRLAANDRAVERDAREELADWLAYERRLKEVPVWPVATGTLFKLGGSAAVPGLTFLMKYVFNRFM